MRILRIWIRLRIRIPNTSFLYIPTPVPFVHQCFQCNFWRGRSTDFPGSHGGVKQGFEPGTYVKGAMWANHLCSSLSSHTSLYTDYKICFSFFLQSFKIKIGKIQLSLHGQSYTISYIGTQIRMSMKTLNQLAVCKYIVWQASIGRHITNYLHCQAIWPGSQLCVVYIQYTINAHCHAVNKTAKKSLFYTAIAYLLTYTN